jgi:choice-of-anchor B domain-containing protein
LKFLTIIAFIFSFGVLEAQNQKNIVLQDVWNDTTISLAVEEARFSDVWGFEMNGQNYCAVGSSEGVEILRVDKDKLSFIDREPGAFQGFTVVHRDYKTFQNYLYAVGDEGTASLQIFDLSFLPDSISKVYDSNALFGICHNIFIDTLQSKLYACGADDTGMKVFDISNPVLPVLDYDFTAVAYVHDCYVANDTAYLNCGFDGLQIYDFSTAIPTQIGLLNFYPDQGYNHSGWLSSDKKKYVFIDETQGTKIKLCKTDNLGLIQVDETFGTSNFMNYVPHNVHLLNNLAFIAYYNEGFRVFDVSKAPVEEIAYFDTFTEETAYKLNGAWGVYAFENTNQIVVCDRQNGVFLFSFPIDLLENANAGTILSNTPFIDDNSILIPRDLLSLEGLTFSIADLRGAIVYRQENYLNWLNIPLQLNAGVYYYGIYDQNGEKVESGKFAKVN